jgi:PTS system mannose-specific IIA component
MIGILLFTLGDTGQQLIRAASAMLEQPPERLASMSVRTDADQDLVLSELRAKIQQLDDGSGVVVLSDIYGATHSHTACKVVAPGHVGLVTGVNLPMLMRTLNYRDLSLDKLLDKAVAGGHNGIKAVDAQTETRKIRG